MGFRTVVMLSNDMAHEWSKDPELGRKIEQEMHSLPRDMYSGPGALGQYGAVVECTHADCQTLVRLDHYTGFEPLAVTMRSRGPSTEEDLVSLLKHAAEKMGYRLVKKPNKKA